MSAFEAFQSARARSVPRQYQASEKPVLPLLPDLSDLGITNFTEAQCDIVSKWQSEESVVIHGQTHTTGKTTIALLLIASTTMTTIRQELPCARRSLGEYAPVAICIFNTREAAYEAYIFLTRLLESEKAAIKAGSRKIVYPTVGLFHRTDEIPSLVTNTQEDEPGDILCTTPGALRTAYKTQLRRRVRPFRLKMVMVDDAAPMATGQWKDQLSQGIRKLIYQANNRHQAEFVRTLIVASRELSEVDITALEKFNLIDQHCRKVLVREDDRVTFASEHFFRSVYVEPTAEAPPGADAATKRKVEEEKLEKNFVGRENQLKDFLSRWSKKPLKKQLIIFAASMSDVVRIYNVVRIHQHSEGAFQNTLPTKGDSDIRKSLSVLNGNLVCQDSENPGILRRHPDLQRFLNLERSLNDDNSIEYALILICTPLGAAGRYSGRTDVLIFQVPDGSDVSRFDTWYAEQACARDDHITTFIDEEAESDMILLERIRERLIQDGLASVLPTENKRRNVGLRINEIGLRGNSQPATND